MLKEKTGTFNKATLPAIPKLLQVGGDGGVKIGIHARKRRWHVLLLGGCINELTVRAKPDIIILLYEKDTQRAACETASVLCGQRYGVLC